MASTEAYVTLDEFKSWVGKDDTVLDTPLTNITIPGVCRAIDNKCGRMDDGFVSGDTATARIYAGSGKRHQWIHECTSITLVEVKTSVTDDDYTEWAATDWLAFSGDPDYPDFNFTPYTGIMIDPTGSQSHFTSGRYTFMEGFPPDPDMPQSGRGAPTVRVTAKWGYATTVPDVIKNAVLIELARWWKRQQSSWADTVANVELGRLQFTQGLHPTTVEMLVNGGLIHAGLPGMR